MLLLQEDCTNLTMAKNKFLWLSLLLACTCVPLKAQLTKGKWEKIGALPRIGIQAGISRFSEVLVVSNKLLYVWDSDSSYIYRSTDAGTSWQDITPSSISFKPRF